MLQFNLVSLVKTLLDTVMIKGNIKCEYLLSIRRSDCIFVDTNIPLDDLKVCTHIIIIQYTVLELDSFILFHCWLVEE